MKVAFLAAPALLLLVGCGSHGNSSYSLDVGGGDGGDIDLVVGDAGNQPLDAYVEQGHVAVKLIPLGCAGSCATVQAVGTGGRPPYRYRWDNGSTNPVRQICPASDTSYSVQVTDSGQGGEVPVPPQTAQASVAADVVACQDGAPTDGGAETYVDCDGLAAGFSPAGANPSLAWSYGWSSAVGSPFNLYPTFIAQDVDAGAYSTSGFPSVAQWFDPANGVVGETGPVPDIQFNPLNVSVYPGAGNLSGNSWVVGPGQIVMAPLNDGTTSSVARWTAPSAGTYGVFATFASAANTGFTQTSEVHVQHNGADLPSGTGSVTATSTSYSVQSQLALASGDTIDFVIAPSEALTYHLTAVDARVCRGAGDGG